MPISDTGLWQGRAACSLWFVMWLALLLTGCRSTRVSMAEPIPELELLPAPRALVISEAPRRERVGEGVVVADVPVAHLNHVQLTETGPEVGPAMVILRGPLQGNGILSGQAVIENLFALLERMPVTDQARLLGNRFAATHLRLDVDVDGLPEDVFLTIEFPADLQFTRERINRVSGELERLIFEHGELLKTVTSRRIAEIVRDEDQVEIASRVWRNNGTLTDPVPGKLLEESRTTEVWFRDLTARDLDPRLPVIAKVRVNHVTGESTREIYGLFPLPIERIDGQYVSTFHFSAEGRMEGSVVRENGTTEEEFGRPLLTRLTEPLAGRERFLYERGEEIGALPPEFATKGHLAFLRKDLLRGTSSTVILDPSREGRLVAEHSTGDYSGSGPLEIVRHYHYRDDFHEGLIPIKSETTVGGSVLSTVNTKSYDPATRRLIGEYQDYTGRALTQVWDARWDGPIETRSSQRITSVQYDRGGKTFESETVSRDGREPIVSASGAWSENRWKIERKVWQRPGVILRTELEQRNAFGDLLEVEVGELIAKLGYDERGREIERSVYARNPEEEGLQLVRFEDRYRWMKGERTAQVQTFLNNTRHDQFVVRSDAEGRLIVDQMRSLPGLGLRTVCDYDGASERLLRAATYQNGKARTSYLPSRAIKDEDGSYHLRVRATTPWGLVRHEVYRLDGRGQGPLRCEVENGDRLISRERFPRTSLARITECQDASGRVIEVSILQPGGDEVEGIPCDLIARFKIEADGAQILMETRAVVRGTDIPLYVDRDETRIYFDHRRVGETPQYEVDLGGERGIAMDLGGVKRQNVTRLLRSRSGTRGSEAVRIVESIELLGFFSLPFKKSTFDRAGNLLEEVQGRLPGPGEEGLAVDLLFEGLEAARAEQRTRFHFGSAHTAIARKEVTRIDVFRRGGAVAEHEQFLFLSQRLTTRSKLPENRYLPDDDGGWVGWQVEHIGPKGTPEFKSEVVFDSHDQLCVTVQHKENAKGEAARRIGYQLPLPPEGAWKSHLHSDHRTEIKLKVPGKGNWRASHFLTISVRGHQPGNDLRLVFRDRIGREAVVAREGGDLAFWAPGVDALQWLPDVESALAAASVRTSDSGAFIVSVPELAAIGLATDSIEGVSLIVEGGASGSLEYSPLRRLAASGVLPPLGLAPPPGLRHHFPYQRTARVLPIEYR